DPQTFVNINKPYSKDKNYLYSQEGFNIYSIKKEACNTGELTTIPESRYIRTNTKIYYSCDNSFTSLPLKDTASIEILAQNGWLKVDGRIVSYGVWLNDPQVDEKTFVSLDYQYFKDKNNVYYLTNKGILTVNADADLNTFEQTGGNYAKDKNHVYYRNGILPGVNPKDFRYDDKSSKGYSGKDVYFLGEKRNK
ncbi:MAG: DKNYY domain-containing protein, partial [Paludibacter sp.]|nr:DKNYY domain-containing protein [Paludibacter sp.]